MSVIVGNPAAEQVATRRVWSDDERRAIGEMRSDGASWGAISERMDSTPEAVRAQANREGRIRSKAQWREVNRVKIRAANEAYRSANRETLRERDREHYRTHRARILARQQASRRAFPVETTSAGARVRYGSKGALVTLPCGWTHYHRYFRRPRLAREDLAGGRGSAGPWQSWPDLGWLEESRKSRKNNPDDRERDW